MNKAYKIIEGNYKNEDDVVIQVDTITESTTSTVVNIGQVKKRIKEIDDKIAELTAEKITLLDTINSNRLIINRAIKP